MSMIFFDKIIDLSSLDKKIDRIVASYEEKEELWRYVEEIIHHRVLGCCLTHLHQDHHQEFLDRFHKSPYDERLIDYLEEKIQKDMRKIIRQEIKLLAKDLLFLDSNKSKPSLKKLQESL